MNLHIDQISDFPKNIKNFFGISAFFVCHSPRFLKASTKAFSKLYTAREKRNDTQYQIIVCIKVNFPDQHVNTI